MPVKILSLTLCLFLVSNSATAAIVIAFASGNPGTNVFWDNGKAGQVAGPATTVTGATNALQLVDAESMDAPVISLLGTGGQAGGVTRSGGGLFGILEIRMRDFFVTDFSINLDANANGDLFVEVMGEDSGNSAITETTTLEDLKGNGQNRLRIQASGGDRFNKVTVASIPESGIGNELNLAEVFQFRLGGLSDDDGTTIPPDPGGGEIPEPSTVAIWSVLGLGLVAMRRRFRARQAA